MCVLSAVYGERYPVTFTNPWGEREGERGGRRQESEGYGSGGWFRREFLGNNKIHYATIGHVTWHQTETSWEGWTRARRAKMFRDTEKDLLILRTDRE